MRFSYPTEVDWTSLHALREAILASPLTVALHRAETYTRVFQAHETAPWIVTKALAFREHLRTVPLFLREHDHLAGSLCELPGGLPVFCEIGIGENNIFVTENPERRGYLRDQVPQELRDWWRDRNLWGRWRAWQTTVNGWTPESGEVTGYKFLSCQGHLSPSYGELLSLGLGGLRAKVDQHLAAAVLPAEREFLTAAALTLEGVSDWARRYAALAAAQGRTELARVAAKVAEAPPETFREALQLIWFAHQAIHIEGHGYSCTPDRIDQLLYPFYRADRAAGRLTDAEALLFCANFILKMRDNTVWSVAHNLTQGLCLAGSNAAGEDLTNALSWLFLRAADELALPEPLVWVRWHEGIDQDFFDACLETLAGRTCFPLFMSDSAVPAMLQALGVAREDACGYVPAGCNELAIPGQAYFNPGAHVAYLPALERALTGGRGYAGTWRRDETLPEPAELTTFDDLVTVLGDLLRRQLAASYAHGLTELTAQMRWGQTPFTSCFFDGCVEAGHDLIEGTKYNLLSCGGTAFANLVDCLAAIRVVVYEQGAATLAEVAAACGANFEGHEPLRRCLLAAPKHGRDDPRVADLVRLVERLRDEPLKAICRDPRDGTPFGNSHVVRSGAVLGGRHTPATPDGRLAGTPLASSVAASCGTETAGAAALLNSVLALDPVTSWQCGYNVNLRLAHDALAEPANRERVRALLNVYFQRGGQELQVNCVDTQVLREAQADPAAHRDLVVRVAGFSAFFVDLHPAIQDDLIARAEHPA